MGDPAPVAPFATHIGETEMYNKTIIIGRAKDAPSKWNKLGTDVVWFTLWNCTIDKDGNEVKDEHKIFAVGKQAQLTMDYLHEGMLVCIEGSPRRLGDGIIAERIVFLSQAKR